MEMHAYSEDYLLTAQRILGDMLDYAVNEYEFDQTSFINVFSIRCIQTISRRESNIYSSDHFRSVISGETRQESSAASDHNSKYQRNC